MATDPNPPQASAQDALPRLNALVDGELSPAERASLAARLATDRDLSRAHATLARLKAAVAATVDDGPAAPMAAVRPRRVAPRTSKGVAFTGIAAALLVAVVSVVGPRAPAPSQDEAQPAHTTLRVATLPADPVVPDLTFAGLKLAGIAMETLHGAPLVVATYRGPRGCRLELRVAPAGVELPLGERHGAASLDRGPAAVRTGRVRNAGAAVRRGGRPVRASGARSRRQPRASHGPERLAALHRLNLMQRRCIRPVAYFYERA